MDRAEGWVPLHQWLRRHQPEPEWCRNDQKGADWMRTQATVLMMSHYGIFHTYNGKLIAHGIPFQDIFVNHHSSGSALSIEDGIKKFPSHNDLSVEQHESYKVWGCLVSCVGCSFCCWINANWLIVISCIFHSVVESNRGLFRFHLITVPCWGWFYFVHIIQSFQL